MDIKPPYGYQEIIPLTKTHRVVMAPGRRLLPASFESLAALPLSFAEFAAACRDYPIAFITTDSGASFIAMAVFGLEREQNLFMRPDHTWDPAVYLPAYVRRYPFCMTRVLVNGEEQAERVACVEKQAVSDKGTALHDEKGEPLPVWDETRKLLFEFEADLARTEQMCSTLTSLGLLEAFSVQAVPTGGTPLALTGLHRVSEQKLNELPGDKLRELAQSGILSRIYSHLISLGNFSRLLDRRAAKPGKSTAAPAGDAKKES
jgi:hypothetical protein